MIHGPTMYLVIFLTIFVLDDVSGKALRKEVDPKFDSVIEKLPNDMIVRVGLRRIEEKMALTTKDLESYHEKESKRTRFDRKITEKKDRKCPDLDNYLCLLSALSMIARVRVADDAIPTGARSGAATRRTYDDDDIAGNDTFDNGSNVVRSDPQPILDDPAKAVDAEREVASSKKEKNSKPSRYLCQAYNEEVYVSEIGEMLPAYICKFQNTTFILTSVRFLQDRRTRFNIDLEGDISQHLKVTPNATKSDRTNVISATLVLKHGEDDYKVRT